MHHCLQKDAGVHVLCVGDLALGAAVPLAWTEVLGGEVAVIQQGGGGVTVPGDVD